MTTLIIKPEQPGFTGLETIKVKKVISADVGAVTVIDEHGKELRYFGVSYLLTTWPDTQQEIFGER